MLIQVSAFIVYVSFAGFLGGVLADNTYVMTGSVITGFVFGLVFASSLYKAYKEDRAD